MLQNLLFSLLFVHTSTSVVNNRIDVSGNHGIVRRSHENQPHPKVVFLNPHNLDQVLDQIQMPSLNEMRGRGRPFTFLVEGIVGTGKSTCLQPFKKYPLMDILPEPVDRWTNLNGTDVLQLVFNEPKRWAMTQESYVLLTMLEEHLRVGSIVKGMERSIHSARYCFVETFHQSGAMKPVEYAVVDSWYQFLNNPELTGFDLSADLIVYLQADPRTVYDRIKRRGRVEEARISIEFLEQLHRFHEDWLIYGNSTVPSPVPSQMVLVINTDSSYAEMMTIYKRLAQRIWHLIPNKVKNQQCWLYA